MPAKKTLRSFDLRQVCEHDYLMGVDEAGRGALAGPVVAGAVEVTKAFLEGPWAKTRGSRVNDSKQLSAADREDLFGEFELLARQNMIRMQAGIADVFEIANLNILGATKLAMRRAIEGIHPPEAFTPREEPDLFSPPEVRANFQSLVSCHILVDGLKLKGFPYPHDGIVKGDARSLCIAMASIVAKVTRDRLMDKLGGQYPIYGFAQHKGYGTEDHRNAILQHGKCEQHRDVFLRKLLSTHGDPSQMDWIGEGESESEA